MDQKVSWSKDPPKPPNKKMPSEWYWYVDLIDDKLEAIEIYHSCWRTYGYNGLWWDCPIKQPTLPIKVETKKKKRGRKSKK